MAQTRRGFGLFAGVSPDIIQSAAITAESLGYKAFWVNYPGQIDGLGVLGQLAKVTTQIKLGVGVIPLQTRDAASIIADVQQHQIPLDRLILGIGSPNPGALARVRDSIATLRAGLDCRRMVVAALGPKMCRLAGEVADGVLFNWLTPEYARTSADWVREGAAAAGRPTPSLLTYVRVALGPEARARLTREAANYSGIKAYADHFARMGVPAMGTTVADDTSEGIQSALAAWEGIVDEVVVRGITAGDTEEQILGLVRAAAPRG